MEQLVSLFQKKQLLKEEKLKSLIKIIDRKIVQKSYSLRNLAYQRIKNYKLGNRNNLKLHSEKEEEKHLQTNCISSTNQFREALHQLQNYNLVQLEILKKETLCRMVQILEKQAFQNLNLFFIKAAKFQRRFVPFLKVLSYRLHKQTKFLEIFKKFQLNRELEMQIEMKKQETISRVVQAIQNKKFHCFYKWKNQSNIVNAIDSKQQDQKKKNETIQFTFSIVAFISKIRFKQISNSFIALKKYKQRSTEKEIGLFVLKCRIKNLRTKQLQFAFYQFKNLKKQSNDKQSINVDIIKNLSVISSKMNSILNLAHNKYLKKRRNLILFKYLRKIEKNEETIFNRAFQKWKRNLCQFNFLSRLKIIDQSQQLEDDQQLLVQQYKQLQTENAELQQMVQQVQTYFHTPTGLSVKKSEQKQFQQQQIYQQQVVLLQSQNQEDDEIMPNEDYSPEFVENIENQNVELKFKVEDQQMRRKQYLEEFQLRKQELLSQIAQKRQNIKVS